MKVAVLDVDGVLVTDATTSITLALAANPGSGTLVGTTTVSAVDGVATFADLSIDKAAAGYTLTASATNLSSATSDEFAVTPAAPTGYVILDPTDGTVGASIPVTVEAQDPFGNPVSSVNGSVILVTDGSAAGGGMATITDGTGTLALSDEVAETVTLSLTSPTPALDVSSTQDVVFDPGVAVRYVILDPIDGVAGTPIPVTVRALDQFDNVAKGEQRDITLRTTGSAAPGLVDIVDGAGTRDVTSNVAETVTLSLRDDNIPPTGLDISSTQDVAFAPGSADRLVILNPVDGTVGTRVRVTVEARDQFGNFTGAINGSVTLETDGSATGAGLVTITNGVGTIDINDLADETINLALAAPTPPLDASSTEDVTFFPAFPWSDVALGIEHACGLTASGLLYCWGDNSFGQLGDNGASGLSSNLPVAVVGGLTFTQVDAGEAHTCAVAIDGTAYCWGDNSLGQLGDNGASGTTSPVPVAVSGTLTFASVSAANHGFHTCGVTTGGAAHCWGSDSDGQLGNGSGNDGTFSAVPVPVSGGLTFESVTTGLGHSCGIVSDHTARCWGLNDWHQLGTGDVTSSNTPVAVARPSGNPQPLTFTSIHAGRYHTCGLATGGDGYCWGDNRYLQLGNGSVMGPWPFPTLVLGGLTFSSMTVGTNHTCGVAGGEGYCWGSASYGRLGHGSLVEPGIGIPIPTPIYGHTPFSRLSGGRRFGCGVNLANTGTYCWGDNVKGELGSGSTDPVSLTPVRVRNP